MSDINDSIRQTETLVIQVKEEPGDAKVIFNNDEKEKKEQKGDLQCDAELSDKIRREHIISMLTEKQPEAVTGRPRLYWIYAFEGAPPTGDSIDYDGGDRNDFVRLVFSLVLCMLAFTTVCTFIAYLSDPIKKFFKSLAGMIIAGICVIITMAVSYIFCCSSCARVIPVNYILLIIATLSYTYIVAFITSFHAAEIAVGAVVTTLLIVIVCLGLAFTSIDFTKFIFIVLIAFLALVFASLIVIIISFVFKIKLTILRIVLLILSSVVSSVMLIIELQMILGGKQIELGLDDYCYGAYMVYTSIIDMFLRMLQLLSMLGDIGDVL